MVRKMNTFYDVQQLLKTFGHIVYFGDRELEIEFMLDELKELYMNHMIEKEQWARAAAVLRKELEQTKTEEIFIKAKVIKMDEIWFAGIDLGGTTIKLAFINQYGEIQHKWEVPTDKTGDTITVTIAKQSTASWMSCKNRSTSSNTSEWVHQAL